jgi:hypothetical protein
MDGVRIVTQIPVGHKYGYLLNDYDAIWALVARFWVAPTHAVAPCNVQSLAHNNHRFTVAITDAVWFMLFTRVAGRNRTFLLNTAEHKAYLLDVNMRDDVFAGTLLMGEALRGVFFVTDIFAYKGDNAVAFERNLPQRQQLLDGMLTREWTSDALIDCFQFVLKRYYVTDDLASLQHINDVLRGYAVSKVKAILFVPVRYPSAAHACMLRYCLQHQELRPSQLSLKDTIDPNATHTLELTRASDLPDAYSVVTRDAEGNVDKSLGTAFIENAERSRQLREYFEQHASGHFQCSFNRYFKRWQVVS